MKEDYGMTNETVETSAENTGMNSSPQKVDWNEKYGKKKRGKKKVKPWVVILIVVILLGAIAAGGIVVKNRVKKMTDSLGKETVVEEYGKKDMTAYVIETGTIESQNVEYVTTTLQYPVKELKVKVGDRVKSGDVICTIDSEKIDEEIDALEAQASDEDRRQAKEIELSYRELSQTKESTGRNVSRALSDIKEARNEYNDAVDDYNDANKAYKKAVKKAGKATSTDAVKKANKAVSDLAATVKALKMAVEEKDAALKAAESAYEQVSDGQKEAIQTAENSNERVMANVPTYSAIATQLAEYYQMKNDSVIISQTSGIVTDINATEGLPASGSIMTIEDDQNLQISVNIKEKDIFKVKEGADVELSSASLEESSGKGSVETVYRFVPKVESKESSLALAGSGGDSSPEYTVIIKVSDFTDLLLGMRVKVKIATGNELSVNAVPYTAIMEEDGEEYVYVAQESGSSGFYMAVKKEIETGENGDYYTEITGGKLEEGDKVICFPDTVLEGSLVKIKE